MNPQKEKGDRAERAVVAWLQANGWPEADRIRAGYHRDHGDVGGIPDTTVSVKNERRMDLAGYGKALAAMMHEAGTVHGFTVFKKPRESNPAEWYAVLPLRLLAKLLPGRGA